MQQKQSLAARRLVLEWLEPRLLMSGVYDVTSPGELLPQADGVSRITDGGADGEGSGESPTPVHFYYGLAYPVRHPHNTQLTAINAVTGEVTWLGSPMHNPSRLHGLVVTNDGKFYGITSDPAGGALYSIDRKTGQPTLIGDSGYLLVGGLAYDPATDTIYGVGKSAASDTVQRLLVFDRTTGTATAVGPGTSSLTATSGLTWNAQTRHVVAFDDSDNEFIDFNTTGVATRLGAVTGMPTSSSGLAYRNGVLAIPLRDLDSSTGLVWYDPDTAEEIGTSRVLEEPLTITALEYGMLPGFLVGGEDVPGYVGIAFSSQAPHQSHQLVTISAYTGSVTWLGSRLSKPAALDGLVLTNDYKLYGIGPSAGDSNFYSVDWLTGQAIRIGPTGFDLAWGLAYDAATDTIYGLGKPTPQDTVNRLLVFDRRTGAATAVGPGAEGVMGTNGMAWDPINHRLIVYDFGDSEFWAFDAAGNGTRLGIVQERLEAWSVAHDGQHVVLPVNLDYDRYLGYYLADAVKRYVGSLRLSEQMAFEALEYVDNEVPQVVVTGVENGDSLPLHILFDAFDGDSDARVSLFYDADDHGFNGDLIAGQLPESDGSGSYSWDFRGVPDGEYFLYAEIDDGVNLPQFAYARTPISIRSPRIQGHVFLDQNLSGVRDSTEPGQAGILVYVDQDGDGQYRRGEPMTETMSDDPATSIDETGQYCLMGLGLGEHMVRQVATGRVVQSYPADNAGQSVSLVDTRPIAAIDFGVRSALQNVRNVFDTNCDNRVTPIDALIIINWLSISSGVWPGSAPPYRDVNGDLTVSPIDALLIINRLNNQGHGEGEGVAADSFTGLAEPARQLADDARPTMESARLADDDAWRNGVLQNVLEHVVERTLREDLWESLSMDVLDFSASGVPIKRLKRTAAPGAS